MPNNLAQNTMKKILLLVTSFLFTVSLWGQTINADGIRTLSTSRMDFANPSRLTSVSFQFFASAENGKGLENAAISVLVRFDGTLSTTINENQHLLIKLNDNSIVKLISSQRETFRQGYVMSPQYRINHADLEKMASVGMNKIRVFTSTGFRDIEKTNNEFDSALKNQFDRLNRELSTFFDITSGF